MSWNVYFVNYAKVSLAPVLKMKSRFSLLICDMDDGDTILKKQALLQPLEHVKHVVFRSS